MGTFTRALGWGWMACCLALVGCSDDDDNPAVDPGPEAADIVDTAVAAGSFNTLAQALTDTGLVDTLKGEGPFTVFAPTDAAFAALPEGTLESLSEDQLRDILLYHVVSARVLSTDLSNGDVETVNGASVTVDLSDGVKINDSNVTMADIIASNGVIHVIDAVLLPPEEEELPDIVDTAVAAGSFGTLAQALTDTGLIDTLKGEGPFTVFAPTDDAFAALPEGTLESLSEDQLRDILLYHVVSGRVLSTDLADGDVETVNGASVTVDLSDGVRINESSVTAADILASNGVIHVIDAVLLPPAEQELADIVDTAVAAGSFNTLAQALTDTNLVDTLKGEGPFTVFAPTDEAFAALPEGVLASLTEEQLRTILLYHVVPARAVAADLDGSPLPSAAEFSLFVDLSDGVTINDSSVTGADVLATNGVIHVIDKVLLPPDLLTAAGYAGFSVLGGAIADAGLVETLQGEGPFTVFAPTDEAFGALPEGALDMPSDQLAAVLTYHVVAGRVLSTDLVAGAVTTVQGSDVTIGLEDGVQVNSANVMLADIVTTNGIIHVIDGVLLPQ